MNTSHSHTSRFARWLIRRRWLVMMLSTVLTVVAGYGLTKLELRNDYRVFFSKENPQLAAYERFQKIYTKEDTVTFVLSWPGREVFSKPYLEAVEWLTEAAWKLPFATRVDSVSNFQHSKAEGDELLVGDLVPSEVTDDAVVLQGYKKIAHEEPLLKNRAVGHQPHVTSISVTMQLPGENSMEAVEAAAAARVLRQQFEERYGEIKVHLTGIVMLNNAFAEASIQDMMWLIPLMYLGMFLVMGWILRSIAGTIGAILVIGLSSLVAMGLTGWLGIPLTPPSAIAPTIIMTLAVADSIHFLVTFLDRFRQGNDKNDALVESFEVNFQPIFLTSVTTAIGFLSLNFSDAPPFRHLGNIVAIGVVAAWAFSILFLPALMAAIPIRSRPRTMDGAAWIHWFPDWILKHRTVTLWASVAAVAVLAAWIPRIELNDQWVKYFDRSIEFRKDTDFAMDNLTGIYTLEYSIDSGESGGINDPEYLRHLESFTEWLRKQPGVKQVTSMADIMKRLNRNMHADQSEWHRLPDSRELAAQYLLLYEMSLPFGLDLNNQINVDKSASRVTVTTGNITTREVRELLASGEAWQSSNLPSNLSAEATSPTVMFSYISERNIESMLGGTLGALVLISLILGLNLRSLRFGLISLIPNLVPAILGFGVWALLVGSVGMSLSVVTGMTLGIVVDDTVHFLTKYLRARRRFHYNAEDAVRHAFRTVGSAMVATTVILVIGFGILSFSAFRLNNWMAQLTAIVLLMALLCDLVLLPVLLVQLDRKPLMRRVHSETSNLNKERLTYETKTATA